MAEIKFEIIEDHEKIGKGITLSKDELIALKEILNLIDIENLDI